MTEITKQSIDDLIAANQPAQALSALKQFYAVSPTLGNAQFVITRMPKLGNIVPRVSTKIAFVRSFTVEPAAMMLKASAALYGVDIDLKVGDFNTYAQELLDPSSFLAEFDPKILVIAVQTRDLLPSVWKHVATTSREELERTVEQQLSNLRAWINTFRARSSASVVVHNLEMPEMPNSGILDAQRASGQSWLIRRFNDGLQQIAADITGVYVLDYDGLVARNGRLRWHDEQKWLTARMPISADCLPLLAEEYLKFVLPLTGKTCKALVCDLDNTLWGGVIGEDGMTGIKLDNEYTGAAYTHLQHAILDLYHRGIILAVASKNNHADAIQVFEEHSGMVLKSKHFSALRINWNDKAHSLREIAKELNIGIDSLAFIDDNPVERQRIQAEIPEVTVIDLPADPMKYAATLRACPVFERLTLSEEDRERGRMYAEQRQRTELEQSAGSLEDFYRSLEQVLDMAPADSVSLGRVAQLTQKTNQFNLTTRRCSEADIAAKIADPDWDIYSIRVADKFGDNGIVGVALVHHDGDESEIDTFLLSCRVIGRTVETAIIGSIMQQAKDRGSKTLWGWFLPTAKNAPSADFYEKHGFNKSSREGQDGTPWEYDLTADLIAIPEWITVTGLESAPERELATASR